MVRPKEELALGALYFGIAAPCHAPAWGMAFARAPHRAALYRLVSPCIALYCFVFVLYFSVLRCLGFVLPCIVLYLFCIALCAILPLPYIPHAPLLPPECILFYFKGTLLSHH